MGWMFRDESDESEPKIFDGVKVKFLYNYEHINDKRQSEFEKGYSDYFELEDMYTEKIPFARNDEHDLHLLWEHLTHSSSNHPKS